MRIESVILSYLEGNVTETQTLCTFCYDGSKRYMYHFASGILLIEESDLLNENLKSSSCSRFAKAFEYISSGL